MAKRIVRKDVDSRNLPLTERLARLAALRAELAALKAELAEPEPLPTTQPVAVVDDNELVSADEAAELRKMWGNE